MIKIEHTLRNRGKKHKNITHTVVLYFYFQFFLIFIICVKDLSTSFNTWSMFQYNSCFKDLFMLIKPQFWINYWVPSFVIPHENRHYILLYTVSGNLLENVFIYTQMCNLSPQSLEVQFHWHIYEWMNLDIRLSLILSEWMKRLLVIILHTHGNTAL